MSFPPALLVLAAAVAGAVLVAHVARKRGHMDVEATLYRLLWVGLIGARAAFVAQYWSAYAQAPLDIVDIRDGGWNPYAGVLAAWAGAWVYCRKQRPARRPLLAAMALGSVIWGAGLAFMALSQREDLALPELALATLDGRSASLRDFEGRPTVVNIWATWCPPCVREMPVLERAQAAHPEIHFVFLNQGESPAKVERFLNANRLGIRNVLLDTSGQAPSHFGLPSLPSTLFFDGEGRLVDTRVGEMSDATMAQRLGALRAAKPR